MTVLGFSYNKMKRGHFVHIRGKQIMSQGLSRNALLVIFTAIVLLSLMLCHFAGQLSTEDKARIDSLFLKAFGQGFGCQTCSIDELICAEDNKVFWLISNHSHCLRQLLPTQRNNKVSNSLRNCGHNYNYHTPSN